jgi:hypothetical protein
MVINKEQMRSLRHPPVPLTARLCPRPLPASSVQDRPSHLSNDEPRQPRLVVPKPVPPIQASSSCPSKEEALATRRSKDKAKLITLSMSRSQQKLNETAVSKRQVRRPQSLPDTSLARSLPKSLPIQQLQAALIRPLNDKLRPPVGMTSTRAQASIHPGEVGKERRATYVVNKINETEMTQCSPKSSTVLSPLSHLSASPTQTPLPPHVSDSPAWKSEAKEQICDAVTDESQNTSDAECSPEDSAVTKPSSTQRAQRSPDLPIQATPVHQPPDELPLSVETAPKRRGLAVVSSRHPMSNVSSPTTKTAQRQSEAIVVPSRGIKGVYLARAAAYIQERLSKRSLVCNTSPPGDMEELSSNAAEAEAGQ